MIYIDRLDQNKTDPSQWTMQNILLNRIENGEMIQRTRAARGEVGYDAKTKQITFRLFEAQVDVRADKLSTIFGGTDQTEEPNETNATSNEEASPEWMPMAGGEIILPIAITDLD